MYVEREMRRMKKGSFSTLSRMIYGIPDEYVIIIYNINYNNIIIYY
jgi:hypothetical protein